MRVSSSHSLNILCCVTFKSFSLTTLSKFCLTKLLYQNSSNFQYKYLYRYVSVYTKFDPILLSSFFTQAVRGGLGKVNLCGLLHHQKLNLQHCFKICPKLIKSAVFCLFLVMFLLHNKSIDVIFSHFHKFSEIFYF